MFLNDSRVYAYDTHQFMISAGLPTVPTTLNTAYVWFYRSLIYEMNIIIFRKSKVLL